MNNLKILVNSNFNKVLKQSCIINNYKNDNIFHNYYRLKHIPKGVKTYEGQLNCGVTCLVLGNILKKENIDIKMYLYEFGYGKYKEDHVFLKHKDIIIDPTFRQFFSNGQKDGASAYHQYLFEKLPPFFVGTKKDLIDIFETLKYKSSKELQYQTFDDTVLDNWNQDIDITDKLKLYHQKYNLV